MPEHVAIWIWVISDVIPAPNLAGMQGSHSGINAIAPRLAGTIGSQTDLPSSVAVGTIGNTAIRQFFWLKP